MKCSEIAGIYRPLAPLSQDQEITGIAYDSRKIKQGDLFVALVGEKTDGHQYLGQAIEQGAVGAVVTHSVESPLPQFQTEDTRLALARLSAAFYGNPSRAFTLVGVTGTNGKTTTTHLIEGIMNAAGKKAGVIGTLGSHFGGEEVPTNHTTPQALELQALFAKMQKASVEAVAMEVSSHALDQHRVAHTHFDVAIITNVTVDHLDYHKTIDAYAAAKAKLFDNVTVGIVNRDEPLYERFVKAPTTLFYGIENACDIQAKDIELLPDGSQWTLCTPKGKETIRLRLPGQFNVYNALAAASAGYALGYDLKTIKEGLETIGGVAGRVEVVTPPGHPFTVLVDYAHTPDGLENVLKTARGFTRNRLIAVFGCGGDRDRTKRPVMGRIGTTLADVAFLTSDNPRTEDPDSILKEIATGCEGSYRLQPDRALAIQAAIQEAQPGDVVVIAGKGHENYQIFKDKTIHFDDREVARGALGC